MEDPIELSKVNQAPVQISTGPRTKAGKDRSSRNALRHGIFSDVVLLPGEPRKKYLTLLAGLRDSWRPVGGTENLLVEKLAIITWRQRRLLIAESAEIRDGQEFWEWDKQDRDRQQQEAKRSEGPDLKALFKTDPGLIAKMQDPEILARSLELLDELRQEIESGGFDKERDTAVLEKIYGPGTEFRNTLLEKYLVWFNTAGVSEEDREREGYATPQECQDNVMSEIDTEIARLRSYQQNYETNPAIFIKNKGMFFFERASDTVKVKVYRRIHNSKTSSAGLADRRRESRRGRKYSRMGA